MIKLVSKNKYITKYYIYIYRERERERENIINKPNFIINYVLIGPYNVSKELPINTFNSKPLN